MHNLVDAAEPRKRARSIADQAVFRDLVDITTANLALAVIVPPASGALAVRRGNLTGPRSRYDHPAFRKQFPQVLDALHAAGLARVTTSTERGAVSSLASSESFAGLVRAAGVTLADFGRHPDEECLRLTRKIMPKVAPTRKELEEYRDTATTRAMREKLRRLNAFLAAANVALVPDGLDHVNDRDRRLTRSFFIGPEDQPRFDKGGRLFGGFWQALPSARRHAIRIDGEPVADLDYSSMFVRLAYAHLGQTPPEGDLYALPGLEGYRSGVKLAMSAMFWATSNRRSHWPEEMGVGVGDDHEAPENPSGTAAHFDGRLPGGWDKPSRLTMAILERHPLLRPTFGVGLGASLQFKESEILMALLGELLRRKVVALPLHDGVLVRVSRAAEAKDLMEDVAGRMTDGVFSVAEKAISSPPPPAKSLLPVPVGRVYNPSIPL